MEKSSGNRLVYEHGLVSNILRGLCLVDQLNISRICRRTYEFTVPWNIIVEIPHDPISSFPKIDDISADLVCRRVEATIDDESGYFYGPVNKDSDLP